MYTRAIHRLVSTQKGHTSRILTSSFPRGSELFSPCLVNPRSNPTIRFSSNSVPHDGDNVSGSTRASVSNPTPIESPNGGYQSEPVTSARTGPGYPQGDVQEKTVSSSDSQGVGLAERLNISDESIVSSVENFTSDSKQVTSDEDGSAMAFSTKHTVKPDSNLGSSERGLGPTVKPIPPLPPPIVGWPTPCIVEEDMVKYLYPLYNRGWGLRSSTINTRTPKGPKSKTHPITTRSMNSDDTTRFPQVSHIFKSYHFSTFYAAVEFVNDIADITRAEKHHPDLQIFDQGVPAVTVHTHTHSAIRPQWDNDSLGPPISRKAAGITQRDIRLAILIETLYNDTYLVDRRGVDENPKVLGERQTPDWAQLEQSLRKNLQSSRTGRKTSNATPTEIPDTTTVPLEHPTPVHQISEKSSPHPCNACGGPHHLSKCPIRQTIPPPKSCPTCGGKHWKVDCPRYNRWAEPALRVKPTLLRRVKNRSCAKCGGSHSEIDCDIRVPPTSPCPNCGGDHWKMDCRQPQAPPDKAMALRLPVPETRTMAEIKRQSGFNQKYSKRS